MRGDRKDKSSVFIFFCSSPFKSSEGKRAIKIPVKIVHICNISSSIFCRDIGTREHILLAVMGVRHGGYGHK